MIQSPVTELEILWTARRVLSDKEFTDEEKAGFLFDLMNSAAPEGMDFFSKNVSNFLRTHLQGHIDALRKSLPGRGPSDGDSPTGYSTAAKEGAEANTQEPDVRKAKAGKS